MKLPIFLTTVISLCCLVLIGSLLITGCDDSSDSPTTPEVTPTPAINYLVNDPLTNGTTSGETNGTFIPGQGLHIPENWGYYLAYRTGVATKNIQLEFDAKGYFSMESDGGDGKMVLFRISDADIYATWNGGTPEWHTNAHFELRKKGSRYDDRDGMHLKFGSRDEWEEKYRSYEGYSPAGHPFEWDPNETYHWTVIIKDYHFVIRRSDLSAPVFEGPCEDFDPIYPLNILIGGTPFGDSGPRTVTYSNVKVFIP